MFLFCCYLTIIEEVELDMYKLRIPNYEVKTIFNRTIKHWLNIDVKIPKEELVRMTKALLKNDLKTFETKFKKIISGVFSYHYTSEDHEYIYHSYLLGLFAILNDNYISKSNRESGEGRYDVMLIPRNKETHKTGVVIEIKRLEKRQEKELDKDFSTRINKEIRNALNQIDRNRYYQDLIDFGIKSENIVKVPIVFAGKQPYINEIP